MQITGLWLVNSHYMTRSQLGEFMLVSFVEGNDWATHILLFTHFENKLNFFISAPSKGWKKIPQKKAVGCDLGRNEKTPTN